MKYSVNNSGYAAFISYRRDSGIYIARTLRESIERANSALKVFLDLDELAGGNFNDALLGVISDTPNFLFVLSGNSLDRCSNPDDWVRKEIACAIKNNKRIIPVFEEGFQFPEPQDLPEDIKGIVNYNGVEYSPRRHEEAIRKIISFFDFDIRENDRDREERVRKFFTKNMISIPSGIFAMGDECGKFDEKPVRKVSVAPFFMMRCPVTQRDYESIVGVNPGNFVHPQKPVNNVSWYDAVYFCNKWSERDGLQLVYDIHPDSVICDFSKIGYRLPTEAEWEYACRAGTVTLYHWGDDDCLMDRYAWHDRNSNDEAHVVGTRSPNAWGLYDMTGNVFEWCWDWYEPDYYDFHVLDNPRGPDYEFGQFRVMRGGSWAYDPLRLRSASRLKRDPALMDDVSGFRCVINQSPFKM